MTPHERPARIWGKVEVQNGKHGLVWPGAPAANDAQISEASVVLQRECASNHMCRLDPAPGVAKGRSCLHCPKLPHISGQEQTTTPLARKVRWPDSGLPGPQATHAHNSVDVHLQCSSITSRHFLPKLRENTGLSERTTAEQSVPAPTPVFISSPSCPCPDPLMSGPAHNLLTHAICPRTGVGFRMLF